VAVLQDFQADARTRTGDPFITRERQVRDTRPREGTRGHVFPGNRAVSPLLQWTGVPAWPELTYPFCTRPTCGETERRACAPASQRRFASMRQSSDLLGLPSAINWTPHVQANRRGKAAPWRASPKLARVQARPAHTCGGVHAGSVSPSTSITIAQVAAGRCPLANNWRTSRPRFVSASL